ncbi:hypothetical protein HK100_001711 [Physocladia obscura]|uniref:Uncharacterized protein n=1 Tax=Physocladia obscura TaxID=109957 RepID=A0AAD5T7G7_9FUNG|nr:hypothetical protein HK100_001711 [Physocladia obscura]
MLLSYLCSLAAYPEKFNPQPDIFFQLIYLAGNFFHGKISKEDQLKIFLALEIVRQSTREQLDDFLTGMEALTI